LKSDKRGDDGGREVEGMGYSFPAFILLVAALVTGAAYAANEDQDIKEDVKDLNGDMREPGRDLKAGSEN
jgi:hypothetical protein